MTLQRAGAAQSTGLRYLDYEEPELALGAFLAADTLLRGLADKPDFPDNGAQSADTFRRLKTQLPTQIDQCRHLLPIPQQ